jgi:FkbM family methyltransferase
MDYRTSDAARKQSWHGAKRYAKRFLSWRVPHLVLRQMASRGAFGDRSGRLPAPAALKEVRGHVGGADFVMVRPDRCEIAKELYWGGGHRPRPEDALALEVFAALARRSSVAVDVGAYTGVFTVAAAAVNPNLTAHAFEIVPEVYKTLFDNCVRNGILHRVTLHHSGLGTPDTLVTVPVGTGGSALPSFYSTNMRFTSGVRVRLEALDGLVPVVPEGAGVVMKIDVEGSEPDVIRHGLEFLRRRRPHILCEVLPTTGTADELNRLLGPLDYRFHLVSADGLEEADAIGPDPRFRDWLITTLSDEDVRGIMKGPASS